MHTFMRALVGAVVLCFSVLASAGQVDINSADAAVIAETMVGIGPKKAEEIVRYREANGPFSSLEQLVEVKGVGLKTIEQNRDRVVAIVPDNRQ